MRKQNDGTPEAHVGTKDAAGTASVKVQAVRALGATGDFDVSWDGILLTAHGKGRVVFVVLVTWLPAALGGRR